MPTTRRRSALVATLGSFVQQYGRKSQKGVEPNDRRYSRAIEEVVKHLPPEDLSELLAGDIEEPLPPPRKKKQLKPDPFATAVKRKGI